MRNRHTSGAPHGPDPTAGDLSWTEVTFSGPTRLSVWEGGVPQEPGHPQSLSHRVWSGEVIHFPSSFRSDFAAILGSSELGPKTLRGPLWGELEGGVQT